MARRLRKKLRTLHGKDPMDDGFRRLRFVRYADDFILSWKGSGAEAEAIKLEIKTWLAENLGLELSDEKTLIT